MESSGPLLEARHISKAFPGVQALNDVSLAIYPGEVHVLLGQNGAGKSTLIKALYGAYHPDAGEFLFEGASVRLSSPSDATRLGIAVMFQEFSLVPYLDVSQNIFLGREPAGAVPGTIDRGRMRRDAARLLDQLGAAVDAGTAVHRLGVAQQQMVEIAKALSQKARLLVMDEPTAALSDPEIERLFAIIRRLKSEGVALVYISHRLHEIFEIGDRITVLRDGRKVAETTPGETTPSDLVRLMVGREVSTTYRRRFCEAPGRPVLEVRGLRSVTGVRDSNLVVRSGEIVGLAGLVGAGRTELVRAIFGADRAIGGEVRLLDEPLSGGPPAAVRAGMGLVPEDRKRQGLALVRSVQDNLLVAGLRLLFPTRWFEPRRAFQAANELIARLRVATPSPRRAVQFLSGGNQQKVVIGKWLNAKSRLFILDEPTRGIDVGAKAELFLLMEALVADGAAVLMISSELPELVATCDRAYVMRDKQIVGELSRSALNEEAILRLAMHHATGEPAGSAPVA
jgi:ribose transport system ATP-binding protein